MNTLTNWDYQKEHQKAVFLDVLYNHYQRTNGLYTGLWEEFCLKEAGPTVRDMFFERQAAIKEFEEMQALAESQTPISDT